MKRTALILAGALAFDLGVMAVAAQARQQTREPPRGPATGALQEPSTTRFRDSTARGTTCRPGESGPCRPPAGPTGGRAGGMSGLAVQDPTGPGGNGGCTPGLPGPGRPTGPCAGEPASISDQAAAGNLTSYLPAAESDGHKHSGEYRYLKIDAALPLRACLARRGEVVRHEGVRQCRLPATARLEDANSAMGEVSTTR
ncbi:hypothetical protein [uncultured Brevundimonas sp.]|uniref:hypothetical protein n=1 Tax=uncultured Brevundimonas sp. TaxID=213418 RepID=UPI002601DC63|nr:hypothetical protein [uncultured Brevundimonas sp.]